MITIRFATSDRQQALRYLRKFYPNSSVEDTEESAAKVLDLVAGDVFRIPDPDYHGGTIYPSKNWPKEKENQKAATSILHDFHNSAMQTVKET